MTTTEPLFYQAPNPSQKTGRPMGARAAVIRDPRSLGIHHFAFVRSSILGLDLAESFDRYIAWALITRSSSPSVDFRSALDVNSPSC